MTVRFLLKNYFFISGINARYFYCFVFSPLHNTPRLSPTFVNCNLLDTRLPYDDVCGQGGFCYNSFRFSYPVRPMESYSFSYNFQTTKRSTHHGMRLEREETGRTYRLLADHCQNQPSLYSTSTTLFLPSYTAGSQ